VANCKALLTRYVARFLVVVRRNLTTVRPIALIRVAVVCSGWHVVSRGGGAEGGGTGRTLANEPYATKSSAYPVTDVIALSRLEDDGVVAA
jgi:hypothetical protein